MADPGPLYLNGYYYTHRIRPPPHAHRYPHPTREGGRMDTLFRVLSRHLRTIWHSVRSLFLSLRFRQLATSTDNQSATTNTTSTTTTTTNTNKADMTNTTTTTTTRLHRPPTPMPASSFASRLATLSLVKTRAYQWACERARNFRARMMRERRTMMKTKTIGTTSTKRTVYASKGVAAMGPGKEDVVGAMDKYCEEDANEAEDGEEEEVDDREGDVNENDDPDGFEALFKSLSSSPTLRLDAWRSYSSPFSPSQSLPSPASASTPGLLTPALLEPELLYALPSPTISCVSSSASRDTSMPATPTTPGTHAPCPRPHPLPRSRAHFRTFSASIAARSPLSLSFPLPISLSLPLAARWASSPGGKGAMHSFTNENENEQDEDGVEDDGVGEGEDPFGTYGRAYYAPGARAALGRGNAYDLSAWTWAARDCAPYRDSKKRKRHGRAERQYGIHTDALTKTAGAAVESGPVYRAPIHAASAPQLSCAQLPDRELEYLRALAKATVRGRVTRPPGHETARAKQCDVAPSRHRSGIRPLLLPQKLGLSGGGVPGYEMVKTKADAVAVSGGHRRRATGWELDLERGVLCEDGDDAGA